MLVCRLSAEKDWFLEEVIFLHRYLRANSRVFTDCKQTSSRLKDKRPSRTFVKKGGWVGDYLLLWLPATKREMGYISMVDFMKGNICIMLQLKESA